MKIAVIGSGAMGCLYGALLSSVAEVVLFDLWQEHVRAIQNDGLQVEELDGSQRRFPIRATSEVGEVGAVDLALVFVKSHQTVWAADIARQVLAPDGVALTLQNGVGNREALAGVLGDRRAVQGVTSHGATLLGPGRVRHAGKGPTYLALSAEDAGVVRDIAAVFEAAGLETHVSDSLDTLIWGKLLINVGINALTGILWVQNGRLAEIAPARELMGMAVREAADIVAALGISLPYPNPVERVEEVARATGANRSSMLQDVMRSNPTEIDVINGVIVREGARLGIPTPVNSTLVLLVKSIEASYEARLR